MAESIDGKYFDGGMLGFCGKQVDERNREWGRRKKERKQVREKKITSTTKKNKGKKEGRPGWGILDGRDYRGSKRKNRQKAK